jgi:tripartite-type tricarboxylate transporter receptor subunit TctC
MEAFARAGNFKVTHVPYKSASDIVTGLMSGQVDIFVGAGSPALDGFIKDGRARLLASMSETRLASYPNVPTLKEEGFNVVALSPFGVVGPIGMDIAIVNKLDHAFALAIKNPEFNDLVKRNLMEIKYMGPIEYQKYAEKTAVFEKEQMQLLLKSMPKN